MAVIHSGHSLQLSVIEIRVKDNRKKRKKTVRVVTVQFGSVFDHDSDRTSGSAHSERGRSNRVL
jgi:hypothetical protein